MCYGYSMHGKDPDHWFTLVRNEEHKLDVKYKVKKSYVSKILFSTKDHAQAVCIELENGIRLYGKTPYYIGHTVYEVRKKWQNTVQ